MSAGSFSSSKYESNSGGIYAASVQPETLSATIDGVANAAPAGGIDQQVSAIMRGSRRQIGVVARTVTLAFTGALPDGYAGGSVSIPVMTPATYTSWTATRRKTGTYLGVDVEVSGSSSESIR